jgi:hypothetical protein
VCESSVPTCCKLDFLFRAEFAMHRSLSAAIPARSMVITPSLQAASPVSFGLLPANASASRTMSLALHYMLFRHMPLVLATQTANDTGTCSLHNACNRLVIVHQQVRLRLLHSLSFDLHAHLLSLAPAEAGVPAALLGEAAREQVMPPGSCARGSAHHRPLTPS